MSALKKNAGFYLKRVNDPPHDFIKAIRELQAEAQSRRIVTTNLEGLFRALQCEVSGADYDEDRHAAICDLLSLLTYYKLRLVPPSVPCDLEYADRRDQEALWSRRGRRFQPRSCRSVSFSHHRALLNDLWHR